MKNALTCFALALTFGAFVAVTHAQSSSSSNVSNSAQNNANNSPSNSSDTYSTPASSSSTNPATQTNNANGAAATTGTPATTATTDTTTTTTPAATTTASSDMKPADSLSHHDKAFIEKVARGSTNEVALAQLAADHAASADVKTFAQQMITDHTQANNDLMALASQKGVDISKAVEKGQKDDVEHLSGKMGADFDKAYMGKQASCHEEVVKLFQKESSDGKDGDVVAFANKYLPILTGHMDKAKALKATVDAGS